MKNLIILFAFSTFIFSQSFDYVGTDACKMCHKSAKKGAQYTIWADSHHANAFETLKSEASAKIAAEKGLKVPAYEAAECLICHTTGYDNSGYEVKDAKFWDEKTEKGKPTKAVKRMAGLQAVGCEACHGPGKKYKTSKVMKALFADTQDAKAVGLLEVNEATCVTCHNEKSPTHKPFVFAEKVKEIAHPYPADIKVELIEKFKAKK